MTISFMYQSSRFCTARCDRMSRCSGLRCFFSHKPWQLDAWLAKLVESSQAFLVVWMLISLLLWCVWFLWQNVHICMICQCSVGLCLHHGALWAQIIGICWSLCPRWWYRVWSWSQWPLEEQYLPRRLMSLYLTKYCVLWRVQRLYHIAHHMGIEHASREKNCPW